MASPSFHIYAFCLNGQNPLNNTGAGLSRFTFGHQYYDPPGNQTWIFGTTGMGSNKWEIANMGNVTFNGLFGWNSPNQPNPGEFFKLETMTEAQLPTGLVTWWTSYYNVPPHPGCGPNHPNGAASCYERCYQYLGNYECGAVMINGETLSCGNSGYPGIHINSDPILYISQNPSFADNCHIQTCSECDGITPILLWECGPTIPAIATDTCSNVIALDSTTSPPISWAGGLSPYIGNAIQYMLDPANGLQHVPFADRKFEKADPLCEPGAAHDGECCASPNGGWWYYAERISTQWCGLDPSIQAQLPIQSYSAADWISDLTALGIPGMSLTGGWGLNSIAFGAHCGGPGVGSIALGGRKCECTAGGCTCYQTPAGTLTHSQCQNLVLTQTALCCPPNPQMYSCDNCDCYPDNNGTLTFTACQALLIAGSPCCPPILSHVNGVRSCCDPSVQFQIDPTHTTMPSTYQVGDAFIGTFSYILPAGQWGQQEMGCWEAIDNAVGLVMMNENFGPISSDCSSLVLPGPGTFPWGMTLPCCPDPVECATGTLTTLQDRLEDFKLIKDTILNP